MTAKATRRVGPSSGSVPVREDLEMMAGYHSPQVDVRVRLNTNESPLPPPSGWLAQLQSELALLHFNRYPDRDAVSLRKALATEHSVEPDQIFCANGSNEAIQCLLLAFGGAGRTAAVFEPTYALHSHIARITGTQVAVGERTEDFVLEESELERVVDENLPSVTFLCSPNNPTGRIEPRRVVEAALELSPGLVVVDEAYGQFAPWSALSMVGSSSHLVVVRTFSKTWSMAAARLGYAVAPPDVVASLEQVSLPYHLDSVKQIAGRLALSFRAEMEERVALLIEERGHLSAALGQMAVDAWPSDANFILFRPRAKQGAQVWRELLEHSVLVRDCSSWPRLQGCLRVTVGTREENALFIKAMKEVLGER